METFETIKEKIPGWDKARLFLKCVVIFLIAMLLWMPTFFIMELIREREGRQKEAMADISSKWAGKQQISGPLLLVPYLAPGSEAGKEYRKYAVFMADKMSAGVKVTPEKRKRGIYEVAVYKSEISLQGSFKRVNWDKLDVPADKIRWEEAQLLFQVGDALKGINEELKVKWNDSLSVYSLQAHPLNAQEEVFLAPVSLDGEKASREISFSMQFALNGSGSLLFTPVARENHVRMQSDWPDPAFNGNILPDNREVSDSGFTAFWKFLHRNVPAVWNNTVHNLSAASFGADLVIPVDTYDKTNRSVKYALLCIMLTFAAFFLVETIYKRPLHVVQYGLAGLALVLFYTLLLSISEYTGFNPAYIISGVATIGLVGWYVGSILRSRNLALFISMVLTVVYAYIFTIIQLQDYALLMGSVGLFVALAVIMYFSRRLEW